MLFENLPDSSRVWFFPVKGSISGKSKEKLRLFLQDWQAHKEQMVAAAEVLDDKIFVIAADESATKASGCSIDALVKSVENICNSECGGVVRASEIIYLSKTPDTLNVEAWNAVSRAKFAELVQSGEIGPETIVFDTLVDSAGTVREGKWKKYFRESWHSKL